MKSVVGAVGVLVLASGCGFIRGDGDVQTRDRDLSGITRIDNRSQIDVQVEPGAGQATLTIDDNLQEYVRTSVVSGVLVVDHIEALLPTNRPVLKVFAQTLTRIEASGSGDVLTGAFGDEAEVEIAASGSGDVHYAGQPNALIVEASGSGDVHAEHTGSEIASSVAIDLSGSGSVDTRELRAHDLGVENSGSGTAQAAIAGGALRIRLTGSGDVRWTGTAASQDVDDTGSGSIVHVQ